MITAKLVKELREKTGAGMMDCKKALTESNGDMEKAIEFFSKCVHNVYHFILFDIIFILPILFEMFFILLSKRLYQHTWIKP